MTRSIGFNGGWLAGALALSLFGACSSSSSSSGTGGSGGGATGGAAGMAAGGAGGAAGEGALYVKYGAAIPKVVDDAVAPVVEAFPALTIRTRVVEGNASLALVEASRHAALLVVGNRGHAEFTGLLLGSVSQHCAVHAACPVLIYRHPTG